MITTMTDKQLATAVTQRLGEVFPDYADVFRTHADTDRALPFLTVVLPFSLARLDDPRRALLVETVAEVVGRQVTTSTVEVVRSRRVPGGIPRRRVRFNWAADATDKPAAGVPAPVTLSRLGDDPIPFVGPNGPVEGYVAGWCGHSIAGSEWLAGFRVCEHCPETVQVTVIVSANPRTEEVEWTLAEWRAMTPAQRQAALDDAVDTAVANAGGAGYDFENPAYEQDLEDDPGK